MWTRSLRADPVQQYGKRKSVRNVRHSRRSRFRPDRAQWGRCVPRKEGRPANHHEFRTDWQQNGQTVETSCHRPRQRQSHCKQPGNLSRLRAHLGAWLRYRQMCCLRMDSKTKAEIPSVGGRGDGQSRQDDFPVELQQFRADKFTHFFLLLILVAATVVFFKMIKAFLVPIILAAVFAGLFFPFYSWLLKKARGRKSLSAFICCLTLSLGLLVPAYAVANLVACEAVR